MSKKTKQDAPEQNKWQWLYFLGASLTILGALPIFQDSQALNIVYASGVFGYTLYYLICDWGLKLGLFEQRIIRLNRFASVLLVVSALARFGLLDQYGQNLWIFFLGLALVFILYANILLLTKK